VPGSSYKQITYCKQSSVPCVEGFANRFLSFFLLCWGSMSERAQQNIAQLFLLCDVSLEQEFTGVGS